MSAHRSGPLDELMSPLWVLHSSLARRSDNISESTHHLIDRVSPADRKERSGNRKMQARSSNDFLHVSFNVSGALSCLVPRAWSKRTTFTDTEDGLRRGRTLFP